MRATNKTMMKLIIIASNVLEKLAY